MGAIVLVDGYVRVSNVRGRSGERFISPSVQREQIEGWAKLHGAQIGEIHEELDESGARTDRPLLLRALDRVETGESNGIVVAKLDRFGRSLLDGLSSIERIEAAGGTFVSVQDGLDLGTPTGKFVLRIMFSMAEWELDRVRDNWDTARMRAIARGAYLTSVPVGYRRGKATCLQVDLEAAPTIRELFRRRAGGESISALTRFLDASSLKTARGNDYWVPNTVRRLLHNRTYLGESRHGTFVNPNAHEPLIDAALFQEAQFPVRAVKPGVRTPLAGLVRCASCRMAMHQTRGRLYGATIRLYRCPGKSSQGPCPARAVIKADQLEPLLDEHFFYLLRRRNNGAAVKRTASCQRAVKEAEADLAAYRDNPRLLRTLGEERFQDGLQFRVKRVEKSLLELAAVRRTAEEHGLGNPTELETEWKKMSTEQRRERLDRLIDCVFVCGQGGSTTERVHVCLRGEEPVDLPTRGGRRGDGVRGFDWPQRKRPANRLREPRRWSEPRIHAELVGFLSGRKDWPAYDEFHAAGHARLWHQMMRYGGPWYWVRKLEVKVLPRYLVPSWNDERLRDALRPFVRRFDYWPTGGDFKAAGLIALYKALHSHGGVIRWAGEFNLPRRTFNQGPTPYWTEARVEAELRKVTRGADHYPMEREAKAQGWSGLYAVIGKKWGHNYWAQRFRLPRVRNRCDSHV
jgi:DNA invertase Pin-like site-specific DNA recombinase